MATNFFFNAHFLNDRFNCGLNAASIKGRIHPVGIFQSPFAVGENEHRVDSPLDRGGIQTAIKAVVEKMGIKKKLVAIPCVIAMQRICWRPVLTSLNYKKSWGMSVY